MRSIIFDGELNTESVRNLIIEIEKDDQPIELYFSTNGGEDSISEFLSKVLKRESERIIIFAGDIISSNGFWIYGKFNGLKCLSQGTSAIVHKSWIRTYSYDLTNKQSKGFNQLHELEKNNKSTYDFYSQFLTKKEMSRFKNGGDIFLSTERLDDIFKKYDFNAL